MPGGRNSGSCFGSLQVAVMKTILVVEDELAIADMLSTLLADEGYEVLIAGNGREGLALVAQEHPDLVLSDVMMPILDGREMCRLIRAEPEYGDIPVVLMSAARDGAMSFECGQAAFLSKPFDLDRLLGLVLELIGLPTPS